MDDFLRHQYDDFVSMGDEGERANDCRYLWGIWRAGRGRVAFDFRQHRPCGSDLGAVGGGERRVGALGEQPFKTGNALAKLAGAVVHGEPAELSTKV